MCQPSGATRAAIRSSTSRGVKSTRRLTKLKRTPRTPARSMALSSLSVTSSPTKATPRALSFEFSSASTIARLSLLWQLACTITFLSKPRKSRSANSFSLGASQGVYLRSGAWGNRLSGPNTWQCASTAPAGGRYVGFDGLGWNGMYPALMATGSVSFAYGSRFSASRAARAAGPGRRSGRPASVPIPKFASLRVTLVCELRNQGTPAIYDSSAVFGFEVPTQTRGHNDRNSKSTALDALERERYALPHAHAHGGKRALAAALLQAVDRGQRNARARHSERMPERDRAAVR